jgi:succinate-acetate transporter protein
MCFVMCRSLDNCVGVLVICVHVFTLFCIVCTVFLYCFACVYLFLFVLSVLVQELLTRRETKLQ